LAGSTGIVLGAAVAEPTYLQETTTVLAVTAIGGALRFVAMHWWIFSKNVRPR
jgi:hypothetical protein